MIVAVRQDPYTWELLQLSWKYYTFMCEDMDVSPFCTLSQGDFRCENTFYKKYHFYKVSYFIIMYLMIIT